MTRPLTIGVLIPCYNYARYVETTIASVLSQTRPADEIILVDDGSSDGSADLVAERFGDRVTLIRQANAGQTAAYRAAFARSSADILQFLDADDRLLPDALARVEAAWRPTTSKVQFDLEIIDGEGINLGRRFCRFPAGYDAARVARDFADTGTYRWPVTTGNAYARGFLAETIGEPVPVSLDGILNTLAPLYGTVETITTPLGQYRIHGANKSHRDQGAGFAKPQFAKRIGIRRAELAALDRHRLRFAAPAPMVDPLDHEIAFLNYRLICARTSQTPLPDSERVARLWSRGVYAGATGGGGASQRLAHILWFTALALAPRSVLGRLVDLRYGRAALKSRLKSALGGK